MRSLGSPTQASLWLLVLSASCSVYNADLLKDALGSGTSTGGSNGLGGAEPGDGDGDGDGDGSGNGGDGQSGGSGGGTNGGASAGGNHLGGSSTGGEASSELIDDMEDNNASVLVTNGRNGRWNTYNDGSGGTQVPAPDFTQMTDVSADPPFPESHFAAYTQGSGFTGFGAVLNVTMKTWPVYEDTPPYDASEYSGLTFLAKVGSGASKTVRLRLVTTDTDPRGGQCVGGGSTAEACYDHFLTELSLTEDWQRYEIDFDELTQTGVGKPFPQPATDGLYAVEFQCPGGSPFELWVDDLAFLRP